MHILILEIKREKNALFRVMVEGEGDHSYLLDIDTLRRLHLKVGQKLDATVWTQAVGTCYWKRANQRALTLLNFRDHSKKELLNKLLADFPESIAQSTADQMEKLGYLNDRRFAERLVEKYMVQKSYPQRRAFIELTRRGIARELAEEALEQADVSPVNQIVQLIYRKYQKKLLAVNGVQKTVASLGRLGFSYADIRQALTQYQQKQEETEEECVKGRKT